jgi:hypothetical protein
VLEQRLDKLEKQARRLRRLVLLMSAALVGLGGYIISIPISGSTTALAQFPSQGQVLDTVTCRRIEVVDEDGNRRFQVGASERDAYLILGSGRENSVVLSAYDDYAQLTIKGRTNRIELDGDSVRLLQRDRRVEELYARRPLTPEIIAQAVELQKEKKTLLSLWGSENGNGAIDVYNALGKIVVSVQANKANAGGVYVHDVNGQLRRSLSP